MLLLTLNPRIKQLLLVLVASVAVLLAGCKSEVYKGLTETQANAMMSVLLKHGIDSEKIYSKSGYSLSVDSSKVVQTLELMRQNNLPRENYQNMGEVFAAKGMISSSTEEQARMAFALSQELSDTFSSIDGVLTARVHVVLGSQDLATGTKTKPSAAVFLRHTPESQASHLVSRIKELTSNAIPGLMQDDVSVMLVPVRETVTVPMGADALADLASDKERWMMLGALILLVISLVGFAVSCYIMRKNKTGQDSAAEGTPEAS
jgi:type III secretion protein J